MALKPLGDRIVVRFEETEEKTASGFVLAGASHEATKTAEVLAVGEGDYVRDYFTSKGFDTILPFKQMILPTDREPILPPSPQGLL